MGKMVQTPIPTDEGLSAEDRVRALFVFVSDSEDPDEGGWDDRIFNSELKLISASATPHGCTSYSFTVEARHCNRFNNLHGGCTATLFDVCTTTALAPIAKPGFWAYAGVSRTLNVTYLRPAPEGTKVLIESEVVHAGKRLCALKGVMKRASDGALIATCEHGKASIDPEVSKL